MTSPQGWDNVVGKGHNRASMGIASITLALLFASAIAATAAATTPSLHDLAIRFRPYMKTTGDDGHGETIRPASWQWFLSNVSLVTGYKATTDFNCAAGTKGTDDQWPDGTIVNRAPTDGSGPMDHTYLASHPEQILTPLGADIRTCSPRFPAVNRGYALHLDDKLSTRQGEPWSTVISTGDGFYTHAEEILDDNGTDTNMVNIEYTVSWPYNSGLCSYHHGDLTTMTLVYDRVSDLITRLSYSAHGVILQEYEVMSRPNVRVVTLTGIDDQGGTQTIRAAQVLMDVYSQKGDDHFSAGDAYVYLAQDPVSGRFEHPVVYAEYNSHEFWPNPSGYEYTVAKHGGDGFSFLASDHLEDLGTVQNPNSADVPFLFFNGAWGTDPRPIMQHNSWYWPMGRQNNPYGIIDFTDEDPYLATSNMSWPPHPAYADRSKVVLYVDPSDTQYQFAVVNARQFPFTDLNTALSFLPYGATLLFVKGHYPGIRIFDRPSTMRSLEPVTFGP